MSSCRAPNLTLAALELCLVQLRSPSGRSSDVSLGPAGILRSAATKVPASASRHAQPLRDLTRTGGRRCWEMQRCLQSSRPRCPARLLRTHRKEAVFSPVELQVRYELSLARRSRACSWVTDILKEKSTALIAAGVKPSMTLLSNPKVTT